MACRLCTTLKGWFFVQGGFPLPFCGCKFFPFSPPPPRGVWGSIPAGKVSVAPLSFYVFTFRR